MLSEEKYFDKENLLVDVMKTEPEFSLPYNFADNMAAIAERKINWRNYWNEFLIYLGAVAGIAAVYIAVAFIWFEANWKDWLNFLSGNMLMISGISLLVIFVLFADRVLLRYFLHESSGDSTGEFQ